jgi:hypothetical protein
MGQADQIAKEVMASETTASSGSCVVFEVPVEVPVGFLAPDGVMRVLDAPGLAHLPLPWRRLRLDATTEIKMPGDHTDRPAPRAGRAASSGPFHPPVGTGPRRA